MLSRLVPITSSASTFSTALLRRAPAALAPRPPRRSRSPRSIAVAPVAMSSTLDTSGTPGETAVADVSATGAFVRKDAVFRSRITADGPHPPEAGRYHLYVSLACPWASRCLAVLGMKGLESAISVTSVHPTWRKTRPDDPNDTHAGWAFARPGEVFSNPAGVGSFPADNACGEDPVAGHRFVRDVYDAVGAAPGVRYTVPILYDKKLNTIVSNESSEIIRDLNSMFDAFATNPGLDLYPERLRADIDEINEWVYHGINNGVYKSGFATSQAAYEEAVTELFRCMDRVEEILSTRRYIAGDVITEADVRLFVTLVRFDEVYVVYFKCNKKCVREYPNIAGYVRDIYQTPGVRQSVNMWHIKTHYFTSHPVLNANAVVPVGPEWDLDAPHGRDRAYP